MEGRRARFIREANEIMQKQSEHEIELARISAGGEADCQQWLIMLERRVGKLERLVSELLMENDGIM